MSSLNERCLEKLGVSFVDFMKDYYTNQHLTMVECAKIIESHSSMISIECDKIGFSLDKFITCKYCNKLFNSKTKGRIFCSTSCRSKHGWTNSKFGHKTARKKRGKLRRKQLLDLHNHKCCECGYNKDQGLCFHHIDPKTKLFTLDQTNLYQKPLDKVLLEVAKCKLYCQNCHAILHEIERQNNYKEKRIDHIAARQSAINKKKQLIKDLGDKCDICDFKSNYTQCFTFHHLDKSIKKFELNTVNLRKYSDQEIAEEAAKCQLLCFNCHMEVERAISKE